MAASSSAPPPTGPGAGLAISTAQDAAPSLVRLLLERLDRAWHPDERSSGPAPDSGEQIAVASLVSRSYLRRRSPDEIEAVLATLDARAMDLIQSKYGERALNLHQFVESIVQTGTYDSDRIVAFMGGVVDLFHEILRSQAERAAFGQPRGTVNWAQVMNHFLESPEISMFEGSEGGLLGTKVANSTDKQPTVQRNNFVDRAKHQSSGIEKIYWNSYVDTLVTVEGNESVCFFSPHAPGLDSARAVLTPHLGSRFYDYEDRPLYHVQAVAWDEELQDVVALLSNRMLIMWRLRNREKCQWQQKRELQFAATRREMRGIEKGPPQWDLRMLIIDPQTGADIHAKKKPEPENEAAMRRDLGEVRLAEEAAVQLDIWWNSHLKVWITTDDRGQLCLWNLRVIEGAWLESYLTPTKVLSEHTKVVTSHLELNRNKFTTISLDRSVILWDHRNLSSPEIKLCGGGAHTASVLAQAYLPRFNSLVTVGCEKRIFVWTIDSTAYRGTKGKLSGHQANLVDVSAGQRLFFTLDEAFSGILWDGASLASLQTVSCSTFLPRHVTCLPEHGTISLAGRRLNFVEGNEPAAEKLGKPPTKEQQANALSKQREGASMKDSAAPRYCGMSESRGYMLSATEVEVRLHARSDPGASRALFNVAEGESITTFAGSDQLSWVVFGTSKGAVHFLKYRSGFVLKVYPGRRDGEEWPGGAGGGAASSDAAGAAGDERPKGGRGRGGAAEGAARSLSPGGAGNRSPQGGTGKLAAASPQNATSLGATLAGTGIGDVVGEEETGTREAAGDASRRAVAADLASRNAPTQEEIQRGLSSNITCVLVGEDHGRVYVGTGEGQVLVFACESGFPVQRWINNTDDSSAVTCLSASTASGLLVVGTQEGAVHIYTLGQLRSAGAVNIARLLFEGEPAAQGAALRHVRLFRVASSPRLPITLLTVDVASRMRLWGLNIHGKSGKLDELQLLVDGGQLREVDCVPPGARPLPRASAKKDAKGEAAKKDAKDKAGEGAPAGEGEGEGAVMQVLARAMSRESVRLSALATLEGAVSLPTRALAKQPRDGPIRAEEKAPIGPVQAAKVGAKANPKRRRRGEEEDAEQQVDTPGTFLTTVGGPGTGRNTPKSPGPPPLPESEEEDEEDDLTEFSGSETEGEDDEVVGRRYHDRPPSPKPPPVVPPGVSPAEHAAAYEPQTADGGSVVFLADAGGWIWCIDVARTVATARERACEVGVVLDPLAARGAPACPRKAGQHPALGGTAQLGASAAVTTLRDTRTSIRLPPNTLGAGALGATASSVSFARGFPDDHGLVLAKPLSSVVAQPDAFAVVGAWPAHLTAVLSLVPVSSPSALVSTDASKEVKVWSTAGDLWGHFSLRGMEGSQPPTAVWPPPHVLATQVSLMRSAKRLCRRMGFHTTKADELKAMEEKRRLAKSTQQAMRNARQRPDAGGEGAGNRLLPPPGGARRAPANSNSSSASAAEARERGVSGSSSVDAEAPKAQAAARAAGAEAAVGAVENADGAGEPTSARSQASGGGAGESPGGETPARRRRKQFSSSQLSEMVRSHAFSSGYQSYRQFIRKVEPSQAQQPWRVRGESLTQLDEKRRVFFGREANAFGVELASSREAEQWDAAVRAMGPRSASEGALLRYAQNAVDEMTRSVREDLGVDVSRLSRQQMRKPSFVTRLDVGGVSSNPADPSSATGQVVRKLCSSSVSLPKLGASAPAAGSGKGRRRSRT